MALINCPECKRQVSDKATSCPSCGYPLNKHVAKNTANSTSTYANSTTVTGKVSHIYECICTCMNCGNEFSYTNSDIEKNKNGRWGDLANTQMMMTGSKIEKTIALNHKNTSYQMNFNKCPKCGSQKLQKRYENYYVNKNGEYLVNYKPSTLEKIFEIIKGFFNFLGNFLFKGCALITLIPFILILLGIFELLKLFFL